MKAYPTRYKSQIFRSRLEAKWAAFFDLLDWPYAYEPFDLENYIPDFILKFYKPILVEVKPEILLKDLWKHSAKIIKSGWDKEILIVGADLFKSKNYNSEYKSIGIIGERLDSNEYIFNDAVLMFCKHCKRPSIIQSDLCQHCRYKDYIPLEKDVFVMWDLAYEKTKWNPGLIDEDNYSYEKRERRILLAEKVLLNILINSKIPLSPELMKNEEAQECLRAIRLFHLEKEKKILKERIVLNLENKPEDKEGMRELLKERQDLIDQIRIIQER